MSKPTSTPASHPVNAAGCYLPGSTPWQPAPQPSGLALAVVPEQMPWEVRRRRSSAVTHG